MQSTHCCYITSENNPGRVSDHAWQQGVEIKIRGGKTYPWLLEATNLLYAETSNMKLRENDWFEKLKPLL